MCIHHSNLPNNPYTQASHGALKRTALYDLHLAKVAKTVTYTGWEMPLNYPHGVIAKHNHVRNAAGLFDVAHMLQFTYDTLSLSIVWYYSV